MEIVVVVPSLTEEQKRVSTLEWLERQAGKGQQRKQYDKALYIRSQQLDAFFAAMVELMGSKEDLIAQLSFYLDHPPAGATLKLGDIEEVLGGLSKETTWFSELAKKKVKKDLNITAQDFLKLKDQYSMSDAAAQLLIQRLQGITCSFADVKKERAAQFQRFKAVLDPKQTPDGWSVNLKKMDQLLTLVYPQVLGAPVLHRGVNIDGSSLGNRGVTAASLRFTANEMRIASETPNSAKNTWTFALYYGPDSREFMIDNLIQNDEQGSLGEFLQEFHENILFLLDSKAAHAVMGLGGDGDSEDFQIFSERDTKFSQSSQTPDTRGEVQANGRRVGLRKIQRALEHPIHPTISVKMFVPCLLHCFSRIFEKKTQVDVQSVYDAVVRRVISKDEKTQRIALLEDRFNEIAAGKTEFKETAAGAPERISLNGRKTKQLLSRALNGESLLEGVVLPEPVTPSPLLKELITTMKEEHENYPITDPDNVTREGLSDAINFHLGWMREFLSADICEQLSEDPSSVIEYRFKRTEEEVEEYKSHAEACYQSYVALFGASNLTGYMLILVDSVPELLGLCHCSLGRLSTEGAEGGHNFRQLDYYRSTNRGGGRIKVPPFLQLFARQFRFMCYTAEANSKMIVKEGETWRLATEKEKKKKKKNIIESHLALAELINAANPAGDEEDPGDVEDDVQQPEASQQQQHLPLKGISVTFLGRFENKRELEEKVSELGGFEARQAKEKVIVVCLRETLFSGTKAAQRALRLKVTPQFLLDGGDMARIHEYLVEGTSAPAAPTPHQNPGPTTPSPPQPRSKRQKRSKKFATNLSGFNLFVMVRVPQELPQVRQAGPTGLAAVNEAKREVAAQWGSLGHEEKEKWGERGRKLGKREGFRKEFVDDPSTFNWERIDSVPLLTHDGTTTEEDRSEEDGDDDEEEPRLPRPPKRARLERASSSTGSISAFFSLDPELVEDEAEIPAEEGRGQEQGNSDDRARFLARLLEKIKKEGRATCKEGTVDYVDIERGVVGVEDFELKTQEYQVGDVLVEREDGYEHYVNHPEKRTVLPPRPTYPLPNPNDVAEIIWPQILDVAHRRIRGDFLEAFDRDRTVGDRNYSNVFPEEQQEIITSIWLQRLFENPPNVPEKGVLGKFSSVLVVEGLMYALIHLQGVSYHQACQFLHRYK